MIRQVFRQPRRITLDEKRLCLFSALIYGRFSLSGRVQQSSVYQSIQREGSSLPSSYSRDLDDLGRRNESVCFRVFINNAVRLVPEGQR